MKNRKNMVDSSDEDSIELLDKLKHVHVESEATSHVLCYKEKSCWESVEWKSALNHIGLFISLSIYVGVGGLVSGYTYMYKFFVKIPQRFY